jgi:hypothetical protein
MQIEPISISFDIPATDPMGHEHVEGKIRGDDDQVILHWKIRERTFTKGTHELHEVLLDYPDIHEVEFKKSFWSRKCQLIFKVCDPEKLEGMPGIHVGRCVFEIEKSARSDAERLAKFLEYKVSEFRREQSMERLNQLADTERDSQI